MSSKVENVVKDFPERVTILLVDDHPLVLEGLQLSLSQFSGFHIVGCAMDGVDAVEKNHRLKPDVVVMDLRLPRLSGPEATRQIAQSSPRPKIIALSACDDLGSIRQMIEAGANGYVTKSGSLLDLPLAIQSVLEGKLYLDPSVARILEHHPEIKHA